MKNIDKIQNMTINDWVDRIISRNELIPWLCWMCVGCTACNETCHIGIKEWLEREV